MSNEFGHPINAFGCPIKPLSKREEKLLKQLEGVVFKNLQAIYEMGLALNKIRKEELYRMSGSFDDYCKERWDFGYRQGYRYISAAGVIENLTNWSKCDGKENAQKEMVLPLNEAQTRPLANLSPDEQRKVWARAVETAPEGKVTARHVKRTLRNRVGETIEETKEHVSENARGPRGEYDKSLKYSEKFNKGVTAFLDVISEENKSNWRYTSRRAAVNTLDIVREVIADDSSYRLPAPSYIMLSSTQEKLLHKGFRIFKKTRKHMMIEELHRRDSWVIFSEHGSVKEMEAAFDQLMHHELHLGG